MERIELRTVHADLEDGAGVPAVVPHLDGVPSTELLRRVELASARLERQPDLAGS